MIRIAMILALLAGAVQAQDGRLQAWLNAEVWPEARAAGVSRAVFDRAFANVALDRDLPGIALPGSRKPDLKQSEFRSPARYFRASTIDGITRIGAQKARQYRTSLARAERRFGVPAHIILAIWGRESGFGSTIGNRNAYEVLATRAFFGPNKDYFRGELVAALKIGNGARVRSSWAGALGQAQMMPTSFLAYGADGDGDGDVDIWGSEADTIFSIARFLADHEWQAGRDWGFEVKVPGHVSCALEGPDKARSIRDWEALGITRVSGRPFPAHERPQAASLLFPAGRYGPAFLVTPNFDVIKRYNRSDLYALFIGNTGDRIAFGMGGFAEPWRAPSGLTRADVADIQAGLTDRGFDTGGVDGLAGHRTRRAIGAWQQSTGRAPTCFPESSVRRALRG